MVLRRTKEVDGRFLRKLFLQMQPGNIAPISQAPRLSFNLSAEVQGIFPFPPRRVFALFASRAAFDKVNKFREVCKLFPIKREAGWKNL